MGIIMKLQELTTVCTVVGVVALFSEGALGWVRPRHPWGFHPFHRKSGDRFLFMAPSEWQAGAELAEKAIKTSIGPGIRSGRGGNDGNRFLKADGESVTYMSPGEYRDATVGTVGAALDAISPRKRSGNRFLYMSPGEFEDAAGVAGTAMDAMG